ETVGVVADERDDGVDRAAPPIVYWPILMNDFWKTPLFARRDVAVLIRTPRAGSEALLKDVQTAVWSIDGQLPIANPRTLGDIYHASTSRTSVALVMLAVAGAMSLVLGVCG